MRGTRRIRRLVLGLALALTVGAMPAPAASAEPFHASFQGTFEITFFTGPGLTHELRFSGTGSGSRGLESVDGYSRLRGALTRPLCNEIVYDEVTLTAGSGDRLELTNEATDCLEVTLGGILIHGSGSYDILGGTGAFEGSDGAGSVMTEARVTGILPGGVSGTFDPLVFSGTIEP